MTYKWFIGASVVCLPLVLAVVASVPAVPAKLIWGVKLPMLWHLSMFAVLGLATGVGLSISGVGLLLTVIAAVEARQVQLLPVRRKVLLILYAVATSVCLAYGTWFNLTRQGDAMF